MNIKKHLPTLARWFSREPDDEPYTPIPLPLIKMPVEAKETPRICDLIPMPPVKPPRYRVPYIPTSESPWAVISYEKGRWRIALYYVWATRKEARKEAHAYSALNRVRTRVVRAIIPTR